MAIGWAVLLLLINAGGGGGGGWRCSAKELQLCVIYGKTVPTRDVNIQLEETILNNEITGQNVRAHIQNGDCFGVTISDGIDVLEQFECLFGIYVKPLDTDEYQPTGHDDGEQNEEDRTDDGPFEDQILDIHLDDIRTMYRVHRLVLDEPNFSRRYIVNLGQIDPPGLHFNRRIFVEPKNAAFDGTFHACLYAVTNKNKRNIDDDHFSGGDLVFLGHGPLVKVMENGEEASTSAPQQQTNGGSRQFSAEEYHLAMPINAGRLFKHKVWGLRLSIFHFEQENNYKKAIGGINAGVKSTSKCTIECPICLENLNSADKMVATKFHKDYNESSQHIFHKDCITKWLEVHPMIRCPMCNLEPNYEMSANVLAKFDGSDEISSVFSMNPIADIFKIANGQAGAEEFNRIQAQLVIKKLDKSLGLREAMLRKLVLEAEFLSISSLPDQRLFELGVGGLREHPIIEQLQNELENLANNRQQPPDFDTIANVGTILRGIIKTREFHLMAMSEFENLQHLSVEKI